VFAPNTQCHAENSAHAGIAHLSEGDLLRSLHWWWGIVVAAAGV
jgi:hypothetical protein